jgi:hypothetical protein
VRFNSVHITFFNLYIIKSRGYEKYHLLDLKEIFYLAIDLFNNFYKDIESNPKFEETVIHNADKILEDTHYYQLEVELKLLEDYKKEIEVY